MTTLYTGRPCLSLPKDEKTSVKAKGTRPAPTGPLCVCMCACVHVCNGTEHLCWHSQAGRQAGWQVAGIQYTQFSTVFLHTTQSVHTPWVPPYNIYCTARAPHGSSTAGLGPACGVSTAATCEQHHRCTAQYCTVLNLYSVYIHLRRDYSTLGGGVGEEHVLSQNYATALKVKCVERESFHGDGRYSVERRTARRAAKRGRRAHGLRGRLGRVCLPGEPLSPGGRGEAPRLRRVPGPSYWGTVTACA